MGIQAIKRALLSVSDKTGIVALAKGLLAQNIEIISTGGTGAILAEAGIKFTPIEVVTQSPEMLDGRVKTLHPKIHGGILGCREQHTVEAAKYDLSWIDLVVVNFYPFSKVLTAQENANEKELIEHIDIGGPTMVRAAAKNFLWVTVVVDPSDYAEVLQSVSVEGGTTLAARRRFAAKVFAQTAQYDAIISQYFLMQDEGYLAADQLTLPLERQSVLRYGENPHQAAAAFRLATAKGGILSAKMLQGKPLSYNNIQDANAALACVNEFTNPTCVIVKHATPCGVAQAETIAQAFSKALAADHQSAFGGIIALNKTCDEATAKQIVTIFMEVVIAPDYTDGALAILQQKPNLRVLQSVNVNNMPWEVRWVGDGFLIQEQDQAKVHAEDLNWVTKTQPDHADVQNLLFTWCVLKHIKSNGILLTKNCQTIGIGTGQVSRIDAVELALHKAQNNITDAVLASDAFFPFRDSIDRLAEAGIKTIIQPGGSVRDEEVIAACDEHGIAMAFTGIRCFKH